MLGFGAVCTGAVCTGAVCTGAVGCGEVVVVVGRVVVVVVGLVVVVVAGLVVVVVAGLVVVGLVVAGRGAGSDWLTIGAGWAATGGLNIGATNRYSSTMATIIRITRITTAGRIAYLHA